MKKLLQNMLGIYECSSCSELKPKKALQPIAVVRFSKRRKSITSVLDTNGEVYRLCEKCFMDKGKPCLIVYEDGAEAFRFTYNDKDNIFERASEGTYYPYSLDGVFPFYTKHLQLTGHDVSLEIDKDRLKEVSKGMELITEVDGVNVRLFLKGSKEGSLMDEMKAYKWKDDYIKFKRYGSDKVVEAKKKPRKVRKDKGIKRTKKGK